MPNYNKTFFISDVHLQENAPEITNLFFRFLDSCDESVDGIYILGDLFETWIGDDDASSYHLSILQALKKITDRGIPIYFLHGNRDFLIGKKFLKQTACQLIKDETKINLYGTPVLLMHGDTLCTLDLSYLKARKILRNRVSLFFFLLLPLKIRQKIAKKLRQKSVQHTQLSPANIMDATEEAIYDVMQKHQVLHLIHGHTHRPFVHELSFNQKTAKRFVLGAWHDEADLLVWPASTSKGPFLRPCKDFFKVQKVDS